MPGGRRGAGTYPAVAEEFTVAAVTVLALLLVGGGGGAGAVLRAAVLVRAPNPSSSLPSFFPPSLSLLPLYLFTCYVQEDKKDNT